MRIARGNGAGDDAFAAFVDKFDPELTVQQLVDGELPEQLDEFGKAESGAGAHFYAVPMRNAVPSSLFFLATGFELGLAFQTEHGTADAWKDITRLIESHDKPEIDSLLIAVGAPDRYGLAYPSEIALMEFALEHQGPDLAPKHLHEIHVHFWGDGRLIQLFPRLHCLNAPLYAGGFIPSHFSLVALATQINVD